MSVLLRINPTRIKRFLRCEYDWYCYAVLGISRTVPPVSEAMDRGKGMHALLEYAFREYAATGKVFDFAGADGRTIAHEIYRELHANEGTMFDEEVSHELLDAARWHIPRLGIDRWEILKVTIDGVEHPDVELDLRGSVDVEGVQLQGIIDLAFRHKDTGKVWLIDWKTTAAAIDTSDDLPYVENDYQLLIGRELLRQHGVNVDISALIRFRSMAPRPPKLTTRGKISVNKNNLACDWDTFYKALVLNDENTDSDSAQKVREHLKTATFVQWRPDITSDAAERVLLEGLRRVAKRMLSLSREEEPPSRHLRSLNLWSQGGGCKACTYAAWCTASLRNGGASDLTLLGTTYRAREWSPLAGQEKYSGRPDTHAAYVDFSSRHGYTVEPFQPFKP